MCRSQRSWRADNHHKDWEQKNDSETETIHSLSDMREFLDVLSKEGNSDTEGEDQICMRLLQTFSGTGPLDLLREFDMVLEKTTETSSVPTLVSGSTRQAWLAKRPVFKPHW